MWEGGARPPEQRLGSAAPSKGGLEGCGWQAVALGSQAPRHHLPAAAVHRVHGGEAHHPPHTLVDGGGRLRQPRVGRGELRPCECPGGLWVRVSVYCSTTHMRPANGLGGSSAPPPPPPPSCIRNAWSHTASVRGTRGVQASWTRGEPIGHRSVERVTPSYHKGGCLPGAGAAGREPTSTNGGGVANGHDAASSGPHGASRREGKPSAGGRCSTTAGGIALHFGG